MLNCFLIKKIGSLFFKLFKLHYGNVLLRTFQAGCFVSLFFFCNNLFPLVNVLLEHFTFFESSISYMVLLTAFLQWFETLSRFCIEVFFLLTLCPILVDTWQYGGITFFRPQGLSSCCLHFSLKILGI